jgi:hypothetical protein
MKNSFLVNLILIKKNQNEITKKPSALAKEICFKRLSNHVTLL